MLMKIAGNVIYHEKIFSNEELKVQVQAVTNNMVSLELLDDEVVAIAMPRTPLLIAIMVALYNLHIPFLSIDYAQPQERIDYMLSNAKVRYVISVRELHLQLLDRNVIYIDDMEHGNSSSVKVYQSELAYILYTSGSTGKPKAVEVTRKGLENFIHAIPEVINFSTGRKIACFTNQTFDVFFLESLLPLQQGLTVIFADDNEKNNPKRIADLLIKHKVQMLQMTPSKMKLVMLIDKELECLKTVEAIMIGGETFPESLLHTLQGKTKAQIYNMYGPTETTIWSTVSDLTIKNKVDIGDPILNTRLFLLEDDMTLAPEGSIGQICIGGHGIARGYRNNEEQTSKSFTMFQGNQIYKTGDLGIYNQAGELECLGRIDNQVKLRGHRIELDEIDNELSLLNQDMITATCLNQNDILSELITFYTYPKKVPKEEFIALLSTKIPDYMVPHKYIRMEHLQYTSSGKIDRKAMMKCYMEQLIQNEQVKIEANLEGKETTNLTMGFLEQIIKLIKIALGTQDLEIEPHMKFENLGFNSMNFIDFIVSVEDMFNIEFEANCLLSNSFEDVASLVKYVMSLT